MDRDEPIPLSALQHWLYCPRQCALIHLERQWAENAATAEGRVLHERADQPGKAKRGQVRTLRALPLHCRRLNLAGIADIVEMRGAVPFPVEYKRGRPKSHRADEVQLCAQALCLEEMFGQPVPDGALFYGETRRRSDITFDAGLRSLTEQVAAEVATMLAGGTTPPPTYSARLCGQCSLAELCQPRPLAHHPDVAGWLRRQLRD